MLSDDSPFVTFAAKRWGKRPVFLFSSFSDIIGTVVCVTGTNSYSQFLAGRIIQGIFASAYESICWACLGDMYFVHQRGLRVSIFYVIQCSLTVFIPIVSGTIATNLGWRWNINIFLILCVVQFICAFLWLYETTYTRAAICEIDTSGEENVTDLVKAEQSTAEVEEVAGPTKGKSYLQQLKVYNGVYDDSNVLKPFARRLLSQSSDLVQYSNCFHHHQILDQLYVHLSSDIWSGTIQFECSTYRIFVRWCTYRGTFLINSHGLILRSSLDLDRSQKWRGL
jgi:hypothetical protein